MVLSQSLSHPCQSARAYLSPGMYEARTCRRESHQQYENAGIFIAVKPVYKREREAGNSVCVPLIYRIETSVDDVRTSFCVS